MRPLGAAMALAAASGLLSSCVALAVPVVAGAAIGGKQVAGRSDDGRKLTKRERKAERKRLEAQARNTPVPQGTFTVLPRGTTLPAPGAPSPAVASQSGAAAPAGMQYLYGSGEAAALDVQGYRALRNHLSAEARLRDLKIEPNSVVLAQGATLAAPRFVPCGTKKLAVVLDIDETALLNLGYEADEAGRGGYDEARWRRWEQTGAGQVKAVPGAVQALDAARAAGITVIFNSNRSEASAAATADALKRAGLGEAVTGETLWLRGEGQGSGKDARRWRIAERYCVVALVGDQLGDFTDLFNAPDLAVSPAGRRAAASAGPIAEQWGAGWFILPNPVYGTALKGSVDEVFPPAVRWSPNPLNGIKKPRPGAIRIPANAPLTKQSAEVMRVWVTHQAGSTVFIDAGLLADPHMFGHLVADTVRHAAKAYAGTHGLDEEAALQRIVDGLGEELREQFNSITPLQGTTN